MKDGRGEEGKNGDSKNERNRFQHTGLGEGEGRGRKKKSKSWRFFGRRACCATSAAGLVVSHAPVFALLSKEGIGLRRAGACQAHLARHSNRGLFHLSQLLPRLRLVELESGQDSVEERENPRFQRASRRASELGGEVVFQVVFWVRVVPGVPRFCAKVYEYGQAAGRVNLIEDEKGATQRSEAGEGEMQPCWTHSPPSSPAAPGGGDTSVLAGAPVTATWYPGLREPQSVEGIQTPGPESGERSQWFVPTPSQWLRIRCRDAAFLSQPSCSRCELQLHPVSSSWEQMRPPSPGVLNT